MRPQKTTSLILFTCSLLAIIVLAASLSNLTLKTGIGFLSADDGVLPDRTFETIIPEDSGMLIFLQGIFAFVTLAFLIFLVVRLVVNIDFKLIGIVALILVLLVGVSYLLPDIIPQPAVLPAADNPIDTADTEPPDKDSQMLQTSQALIWIIVFLITAGLAIVLFNLIQGWGSASPPDSELIRSAEEALTAFHEGMDLRNVILRCYFQMTNTLLTEQGIEREAAMTVWEFEERLQQKGYPAAPITQLTSLFEKIRYGEQDFSPEEEDKALDSLNQIITHAKRNREHQQ